MRKTKFGSTLAVCWFLLFSLWLAPAGNANIIYTEDFEDDNIPGVAGFASSIFVHNIAGPNSFFVAPPFLPPSPPHALFLGAQTTDLVSFNLAPGQYVESAEVWMTGTGGGWAAVTFIGTLNSLNFATNFPQDAFQLYSVSPVDGLGQIIGVMLGNVPPSVGQEALYDNLRITVVPEPSTLILFGAVLIGVPFIHRRRQHVRQ